ncbi:MAG: hypothetical protein RNU03_12575 [Candidatus Sedimenticola sp. (ex Thyasira tokunagai)]
MPTLLPLWRAARTTGKQCGLTATGDYQPSLRSPWLAAKVCRYRDPESSTMSKSLQGSKVMHRRCVAPLITEEPDDRIGHVRICGGDGQRWPSLPGGRRLT